jgi:hypothetical protein
MTSARGETTPGMGKRGGDASWANANLTELENEEKFTWLIQLIEMDDEDLKYR